MARGKKRSQPDGDEATSSKRARLEYGATVTIKVSRQIRPIELKDYPSHDSRNFTVYKDLISKTSAHFQREIARNPGRTAFDLYEVDPEEFKTYLDWLHENTLDVEMVEGASARMLRKFSTSPDVMARYHAAIMFRLCGLLTMNSAHTKDGEFAASIEALLKDYVRDCGQCEVHLSLTQGQTIWSTLNQMGRELQPFVAKWMAATMSPETLEASRYSLSARLFDAIHRAHPKPRAIEVTVGQVPHQQTFTVKEKQIRGHSRLMERVLSGNPFASHKLLLADEHPSCFQLYLDHVSADSEELLRIMKYRYNNVLGGHFMQRSNEESRDVMHSFCEVWILASRLEDPTLQNAIIDAIDSMGLGISLHTAQLILDCTSNGSGLRLWLRDTLPERITQEWLAETSANVTKGTILDVFQRFIQLRDERLKGDTASVPRRESSYYHH